MQVFDFSDAKSLGTFRTVVSLDGVDYQLQFLYNSREDSWYMDITDIEDNPIRSGVKIVINWPLLKTLMGKPRPAGELVCVNATQGALDPTLDDFGLNAVFGYVPGEDV